MNHLINLTLYKQNLEDKLQNANLKDCLLPESFKRSFTSYRSYSFEYFNYTLKVSTAQGDCFIPNQWIYIGALCSQYHSELLKYKSKLIDFGITDDQFRRCHPGRDDKDISDTERTPEYLQSLATEYLSDYQYDDKELLVNFLYNYTSWGGGKNINRGDFTTSPVLSIAHSINDSSGLIGVLAQALAENTDLRQELFESKEWIHVYPGQDTITKNEIFREKKAAAFLKKAIEETIKIDENLSTLMQCENIKKTPKRLQVNSFPLGCSTIQLPPRQSDYDNSIQWVYSDNTYFMYLEWTPEEMEKKFFPEYNKAYSLMFEMKKEGDFYIFYQLKSTNTSHGDKIIPLQHLFYDAPNSVTLTPYLTALRTKPFVLLAGISGTGKSRIVRKLAQATTTQLYTNEKDRWRDNRPDNFELIQVKPNWHNSMDVVGFYSNISKKYEFTPFVEFIVKAWQDKNTPYFLCLDEMNLAPVEEYFAEFLSAIESRAIDENGEYVTDPIIKPFNKFGKDVCEDMLKQLLGEAHHTETNPLANQFSKKGLTLPPNLMVMGTVNMDETTFSFSRKVLDRAMSIEMNEVDYDKFLSGESEQFPLLTDINELLVKRPQQVSEVKDRIDGGKVVSCLKAINAILDGTPFKLGYRAANEAMLYVSASQDFEGDQFNMANALDEFTLMKILSRIEGDKRSIGDKLDELQNVITESYPKSNKKLREMADTLKNKQFVSYWT